MTPQAAQVTAIVCGSLEADPTTAMAQELRSLNANTIKVVNSTWECLKQKRQSVLRANEPRDTPELVIRPRFSIPPFECNRKALLTPLSRISDLAVYRVSATIVLISRLAEQKSPLYFGFRFSFLLSAAP